MPQLIYFDQAAYDGQVATSAVPLAIINGLIGQYNQLGLAAPLTTADLPGLFSEPKATLFDKLTEGQSGDTTIFGLTIKKAKAVDLLELPAGFDAFVEAAIAAKAELLAGWGNVALGKDISQVEISGGVARIKQSALDSLKSMFEYRTTTAKQDTVFAELEKIRLALIAIQAAMPSLGYGSGGPTGLVKRFFKEPGDNQVRVNAEAVIRIG